MGELPLDIHEEILVRLKAKDLVLYKSVCKSWYSLISSRCFVDSHFNYNLKKQADNNEIGHTRIVLTGSSRRSCQIAGSSNGLVCVRLNGQLLVVNPSTHQLIKLKSLPQISDLIQEPDPCMGFGYDSSIDDYKVVVGFKNTCNNKYRFLVLTLRSNVWRSVGELDYYFMFINGVLCNGVIHRFAIDLTRKLVIVSFDLSKEVFKEIPSPLPSHNYYNKLGTMKDRLCFLGYNHKLWAMKNYNVQESESIWEGMSQPLPWGDSPYRAMMGYIPPKSFPGHFHIWMLKEDSGAPVFVQSIESSYGTCAHIWLSISECNYNYDEHVFVESLVSLHGMGNDNRNCNEGRVTMEMGGDSNGKEGTETNSNKTSFLQLFTHFLDLKTSTRGSTKRNKKKTANRWR